MVGYLLWVQGIPGSNPGWAPLFSPSIYQDNSPSRVQINKSLLADDAVFLKAEIVHGLVNRLFDFLPVGSSLNEFIHVLEDAISARSFSTRVRITSGR